MEDFNPNEVWNAAQGAGNEPMAEEKRPSSEQLETALNLADDYQMLVAQEPHGIINRDYKARLEIFYTDLKQLREQEMDHVFFDILGERAAEAEQQQDAARMQIYNPNKVNSTLQSATNVVRDKKMWGARDQA